MPLSKVLELSSCGYYYTGLGRFNPRYFMGFVAIVSRYFPSLYFK